MIHPGFAQSEYENRVRSLQSRLKSVGCSGAVLTSEANYNYFAGYHHFAPWSTFCRPVFVIIPTEGEPVLVVHEFPLRDAERDCWFSDVRGYMDLNFAPIDQVTKILIELGMSPGQIGMELGSEHRMGLTIHEFEALRTKLSPNSLVDIGKEIWEIRLIKSEAEIALLRESGRIAAQAFNYCFENIKIGMTEIQASMLLGEKISQEGGRPGFYIVTSGKGFYDRTAGLPRDRVLQRGDMLWIDLGVVFRGYWTDHCRAAVMGKASQGQKDNWNAMIKLTQSAVEEVFPDRQSIDIVQNLEKNVADAGLHFNFSAGRVGHGIGLMSTEPPHIAKYDDTRFKSGMTFTIEPGWTDEDLGTFIAEENLVVRDDGPELLTVTPRELIEIK